MAHLTRQGFIKKSSVSVAAVAALAGVPGIVAHAAPFAEEKHIAPNALQGPLVAHVRDAASGEVCLLVGEREIVVRDKVLVRHLLKAAQL